VRISFATPFRPLHRTVLLLVAPALLLCASCSDDGPTGPQSATFDWEGLVESGDHLEIRGVNGSIVASTVAGRTATVTAQLRGNGDDVSTVDVQVVEHEGGVTICAIYPDVPGEQPNSCEPDGSHVSGSSRVSVEFLVEVPSDVLYAAVAVNGNRPASARPVITPSAHSPGYTSRLVGGFRPSMLA